MQLINDAQTGNLDQSEVIDFIGSFIRRFSSDQGRLLAFLNVAEETECGFDDVGSLDVAPIISELASTCPERSPEYTRYRRRVITDQINGQLSCILGVNSVKDANLREMARLAIKLTEKKAARDRNSYYS